MEKHTQQVRSDREGIVSSVDPPSLSAILFLFALVFLIRMQVGLAGRVVSNMGHTCSVANLATQSLTHLVHCVCAPLSDIS